MKFDDIIINIGQFGRYQKRHYALLCLPAVVVAIQNMVSVFILAQPNHRCSIPGYDNDTYAEQNSFHTQVIDLVIPRDQEGKYSKCYRYETFTDIPLSRQIPSHNGTFYDARHNRTKVACDAWVYDKSIFHSSIISELNLVCEYRWSRSHAQMFLMLGSSCGAMFLGPPADFFGRKRMMMLSILVVIGSTFSIAFTPSFIYLCAFFFINGASTATVYITTFVLGIELVGPQKRMYAGFIIAVFYGLGVVVLSSVSYFIRDWQPLQLVLACFSLPFLTYFYLVPESARWLISHGRFKDAEVILKRAAKVNKCTLPEDAFHWSKMEEQDRPGMEPIWKIVAYPRLVLRALIISLNWMVCSMTYYGLGLNVGDLAGSIYANCLMYGVVEIICYFVCIPLIERLGRRRLHICCMFLGGIACTVSPFPALYWQKDLQWLTVTLAVIGKFGVSGAFAIIWMYTSELYPTVVRNSGVSSSALSGFLGGVIAPYVANLSQTIDGKIGQLLPLVVFGSAALLAGLLSLYLPETKDMKLPDTLKEANEFGRKNSGNKDKTRNWVINISSEDDEDEEENADDDEAGRKTLIDENHTESQTSV